MLALRLEDPGSRAPLALVEAPVPVPKAGEVLVRVAACGFCHHDLLLMTGTLRRGVKTRVIPGHEISGVVDRVGDGVTTVAAGDRVVSLPVSACGDCGRCQRGQEHRCRRGWGVGHGGDGGFAEYVAISEYSVVRLPDGLDLASAALIACPMGVAAAALRQAAQVQPGQVIVVTGAGGGLGSHAVQMAAALGCRVLAVTSSPHKTERLAELGAAEVLETGSLDFSEVVMALTEDEGADVVIDTVGSPLFPATWRCLAQYGCWVILGELAGQPVGLNPAEVIFRDARIVGCSGVSRVQVREVMDLAARGLVKPLVHGVLPLEDATAAAELLAGRQVLGRLLLAPPGAPR